MTHDLWTDLSKTLFAYLANVSLGDLLAKQRAKECAKTQDSPLQDRRASTEKTAAAA